MFVFDRLRKLRSTLKKMQEPQPFSLQSDAYDEVNKNIVALMNDHDEMKNVLKLISEKNDKVTTKNIKYRTKIQNVKKRLNDLRQENKMLEKCISETKGSETFEKIKRENNCLKTKYKEITSCRSIQFIDEKLTGSQLTLDGSQGMSINSTALCDSRALLLDMNNDFMGFDSMMTSTIKKQIDPQFVSYRSRYHKFRKHSMDAQNTIDSILDMLKKSNVSFERQIQNITCITHQIVSRVKETEREFTRIMRNDKKVINAVMRNLMEGRRVWEQIYMRNAEYLRTLESEINSLGSSVEMKRVPAHFSPNVNCSFSDLEKLSIEELYRKWSKMVILWSPHLEKCGS